MLWRRGFPKAGTGSKSWPLFTESYRLVTAKAHPFAKQGSAAVDDLKKERMICRPYCEDFERGITLLQPPAY